MTDKPAAKTDKPAAKVKLVKMVRPDGKEADVHPDEVESFRKGNFKEVE